MEKLLALYPEAVKEKNSDQKLPLHHAAVHTSEAAVRVLIKAYPDALKEEDKFKKRPLTYAVQEKEAPQAFLPFLEADMPLSPVPPCCHRGWASATSQDTRCRATQSILYLEASSGTSGRSTSRV